MTMRRRRISNKWQKKLTVVTASPSIYDKWRSTQEVGVISKDADANATKYILF